MFHLILVDSELELIPKEILNSSIVKKISKKRNKNPKNILLDSNFYHSAMRDLKDKNRRGRPDLIHICLQIAQESVINHENNLRVYIHTRNDQVIFIDYKAKLPKSYNRFVGLVESLFVKRNTPYLNIEDMNLEDLIKKIDPSNTIAFSEEGNQINLPAYLANISDDTCFLVGGFSHGEFLTDIEKLSDQVINIYSKSLNAQSVVCELLTCLRYSQNIF